MCRGSVAPALNVYHVVPASVRRQVQGRVAERVVAVVHQRAAFQERERRRAGRQRTSGERTEALGRGDLGDALH